MVVVFPCKHHSPNALDLHCRPITEPDRALDRLVQSRHGTPAPRHMVRGTGVKHPCSFIIFLRENAFLIEEHALRPRRDCLHHVADLCHQESTCLLDVGMVNHFLPFFTLNLCLAFFCKVTVDVALVTSTFSSWCSHRRELYTGVTCFTAATCPRPFFLDIASTTLAPRSRR